MSSRLHSSPMSKPDAATVATNLTWQIAEHLSTVDNRPEWPVTITEIQDGVSINAQSASWQSAEATFEPFDRVTVHYTATASGSTLDVCGTVYTLQAGTHTAVINASCDKVVFADVTGHRTNIHSLKAEVLKEPPTPEPDPIPDPDPDPEPTAQTAFPHLTEEQAAAAQPIFEAAQIPATDYAAHDAKWVELAQTLPDSSSRNHADGNSALTERWIILERDGTWTHPTAGYGNQQGVDEIQAAWVDYLSWLSGSPTYLDDNGNTPNGWSGYMHLFFGFNGWIANYAPQKYKHL